MKSQPERRLSYVILAKEASSAKTRLSPDRAVRSAVALRLAQRTIEVVCRARHTGSVVVVTSDSAISRTAQVLGVDVVAEGRPVGINSAAALGRRRALALRPDHDVAILVADLPHLTENDLDAAAAEYLEIGEPMFVADHLTEGTTCLIHPATRRPGIAFGHASARMHRRLGYLPAQRPLLGLRIDLDTPQDMVHWPDLAGMASNP